MTAYGGNCGWDMAPIKNISEAGIMFQAANYFARGSIMKTEILYPANAPGKICKGNVMRCNKVKERENLYEVVIDMSGLNAETKHYLHKKIEAFFKKRASK